ncbi:MAG: periplasmic heavy metal sensor [Ignavibacteriae bacterium]|nr:MAG: periplasmic heavy metal sensor [Ignavibacteriota bacterium]
MAQDNLTGQENVNPVNTNTKKRFSKGRIILIVLLIFVIIAGAAGITFAQKIKQFRHDGPWMFMMGRITKELNLDDKQKAEMEKIREEIKAKMESNRQNRQNDMAEFENLFKQNSINKEDLKQLVDKREQKRDEMKDFFMDEFIKFHALLTPEQRLKAIEKMHEMKSKRDKFFNHEDKLPPNN